MSLTAEEKAELRDTHRKVDSSIRPYCQECKLSWPCQKIRLLDALERAERERDYYRKFTELISSPGGPFERAVCDVPLALMHMAQSILDGAEKIVEGGSHE